MIFIFTPTHLWRYTFFWVFPRRLNIKSRRFGTHCRFHLHRWVGLNMNYIHIHTYPPVKMEPTECSETSTFNIQTPGKYPEESTLYLTPDVYSFELRTSLILFHAALGCECALSCNAVFCKAKAITVFVHLFITRQSAVPLLVLLGNTSANLLTTSL
jgi:hypothetical protein